MASWLVSAVSEVVATGPGAPPHSAPRRSIVLRPTSDAGTDFPIRVPFVRTACIAAGQSLRSQYRGVLYTGDMKKCSRCGTLKTFDSFHAAPRGKHLLQSWCKECKYEAQRQARLADPEKNRLAQRRHLRETRQRVLDALGACCAHCGYAADMRGLEIDHVNEDGHVERKARVNGLARSTYYRNMLRSIAAGDHGLQVLCGTCHSIKTRSAWSR